MDNKYCYPNTHILKNRLDIHSREQLLMVETNLVSVRLYQLQENLINGSFDYNHPHPQAYFSRLI